MSVGSGSVWVTFVLGLALVRLRVCVGLLLGGLLLALLVGLAALAGVGVGFGLVSGRAALAGNNFGHFFHNAPKMGNTKIT